MIGVEGKIIFCAKGETGFLSELKEDFVTFILSLTSLEASRDNVSVTVADICEDDEKSNFSKRDCFDVLAFVDVDDGLTLKENIELSFLLYIFNDESEWIVVTDPVFKSAIFNLDERAKTDDESATTEVDICEL